MALLSVKQVSEALSVTQQTVRDWIAKGELTSIRLPGRWRIDEESLRAFTAHTNKNRLTDNVDEPDI